MPADDRDVHTEHCCVRHGCKYGDEDCTVALRKKQQSYPCETCGWVAERRLETFGPEPPGLKDRLRRSASAGTSLEITGVEAQYLAKIWAGDIDATAD